MIYPRWLQSLLHINRLPEVVRCVRVFRQPGALIARYLRSRAQDYPQALETRFGHRMKMECYHDDVTAWVIFCRQEYTMPPAVSTILDIGANYGAFSIWANQQAPAARIISVEPFPDCFARLQFHVKTNDLTERISTWNCGLGQSSQDRYLSVQGPEDASHPSQSRPFVGELLEKDDSIKISVLSLEDLVTRACSAFGCDEIDYVKIDVEGVEHTALIPSAVKALGRVRNLSMEYHPNGSKAALFATLASAGLICVADIAVHENSGVAQFTRPPSKSADRDRSL